MKDHEFDCLIKICENLLSTSIGNDYTFSYKKYHSLECFSGYFLGYTIPQISKEFDLLRFGEKNIINIELKRESPNDEKIKKQLIQNKYYLNFLNKELDIFSFVLNENKLYKLNINKDELKEVDFKCLNEKITHQKLKMDDPDKLFDVSNYLVSPFNSTNAFIDDEYFLTGQQKEIKKKIMKKLESGENKYFPITGKAGTGKTLLIYDIAKTYLKENKKVLIITCMNLNEGQKELNKEGWEIIPIRHYKDYINTKICLYDLIIIDEFQRIREDSLKDIVSDSKKFNKPYIFSFDPIQTLGGGKEIGETINSVFRSKTTKYDLTKKIRTNKELAWFIKSLTDKKKNDNISKIPKNNIQISYFNNFDSAEGYIIFLIRQKWKFINYTPSRYCQEHLHDYQIFNKENVHEIIGQEFDNIVVLITPHIYYNEEGKLTSSETYYNEYKMMYQILTRVRKKLNIVIVNNTQVLERCTELINKMKG